MNAVDRSNSGRYICSGDDFSKVRILKFPSLKKSSQAVTGNGHSSHVTNVKWDSKDEYIYSTGGEDQCVIIWKVTEA